MKTFVWNIKSTHHAFVRTTVRLLFSVKFCEVKTQLRLHFFFGRSSHLALKRVVPMLNTLAASDSVRRATEASVALFIACPNVQRKEN